MLLIRVRKMIIPVRCLSCGKVIADKWEAYTKEVATGKSPKKALDDLGIKRYCCRAVFLTTVPLIDNISRFKRRSIPILEEPKQEELSEIEAQIAERAKAAEIGKTGEEKKEE